MSNSNEVFTTAILNKAVVTHTVNNFVVEQRARDGYINATALASAYKQATGKRRDVGHWLELERTKETLQHLSSITGIPVIELYQVFRGSPSSGGGTWLHPQLAVRFGIWLSDEFGYLVEEWVKQWLTGGFEPNYDKSLIAAIATVMEQALTPINQRLDRIEQRLSALPPAKPSRPWTLSASTPADQVPPDYLQIEDGSWLSPEAYQSILRQGKRALAWDLRQSRNFE